MFKGKDICEKCYRRMLTERAEHLKYQDKQIKKALKEKRTFNPTEFVFDLNLDCEGCHLFKEEKEEYLREHADEDG